MTQKKKTSKKTSQLPLSKLPVAKGRPRGRRCYVCRETKDPNMFRYSFVVGIDPPKTHRTCFVCAVTGRTRTFKHTCPECGKRVESSSNRATLCSDACRAARIKKSEKRRGKSRKTRASRSPKVPRSQKRARKRLST